MSALSDIESSTVHPAAFPDVARKTPTYYASKVLSGVVITPSPRIESVSVRISTPDFNLAIDGPVVQLKQDKNAGRIFITAAIDTNVEANIILAGRLTEQGSSLDIDEVSFRLSPAEDSARADFVASTLNAVLNLSHLVHLRMPEIGLDLELSFGLPLIEIGKLLQSRQTSYHLMTIERATGIRFDLPAGGFSGVDIAAIVFIFRAIVDRVFTYHLINGIPIVFGADAEGAKRLRSLGESGVIAFGPEAMSKRLLGVEISLGMMTVKIQDPYVEEIERVREEVARGDGHPVTALIRSASNRAVFELPESPRLPSDPWDKRIQALINLESSLDSHLVARYHALAASTLAGLSEEERVRVTRRVELDDDAFLID